MFVDHVTINVKAGNGGNGMVASGERSMNQMVGQLVATVAVAAVLSLKLTRACGH